MSYICDLCGFGAVMRYRFLMHMRNRHSPKELRERFKCKACKFETIDKGVLRIHEEMHISTESHPCHCGKIFLNKFKLSQHQKMVHERIYKHYCKFCPRYFPNKASLREHELIHHIKKNVCNVACDQCDKKYVTECIFNQNLFP